MRSVGKDIKDIDNLILRRILKDSKQRNICMSPVQISIIKYLYKNRNNTIYQKDIENELHLRRSTISGIINTMEKNNMVKRESIEEDGRIKKIILTERMYDKANEMKKKIKEFDELTIKGIKKDDLDIFYKVVDQIKENLKEDK